MEYQKIYLQVWFTICEASKATMTVPKFRTASLSKRSSVSHSNSIKARVPQYNHVFHQKKRSGQKPTFPNLTKQYWKKEPMKLEKIEGTKNVSILSILTRIAFKSFSQSNYHDGHKKFGESDSQSHPSTTDLQKKIQELFAQGS